MADRPLSSLDRYSQFVAEQLNQPEIMRSTVSVWSVSPYTGIAEGEVFFTNGIWLRLREELDFHDQLITSYGYEVYRDQEKLFWYDDFPHPQDPGLSATFPHHKHVEPNIRRNRVPAPGISFTEPNLPMIIHEIRGLESKTGSDDP